MSNLSKNTSLSPQIFLWSVSHLDVGLDEREVFALEWSQAKAITQSLLELPAIHGVMTLSTCNRTEVLVSHSGIEAEIAAHVLSELQKNIPVPLKQVEKVGRMYSAELAIKHLIEVCSGMQSQVLGEAEIFGQVKTAKRRATEWGAIDSTLEEVFQFTTRVVKDLRTHTALGKEATSIISIASSSIYRIIDPNRQISLGLIGLGEMNRQLLKQLYKRASDISIFGRSIERVEKRFEALKQEIGDDSALETVRIDKTQNLAQYINELDVLVCCTSSHGYKVTADHLEKRGNSRPDDLFVVIDLSVPRDVEPSASQIPGIFLYNLEQLQTIQTHNLAARKLAVAEASTKLEHWVLEYKKSKTLQEISAQLKDFKLGLDHAVDSIFPEAKDSPVSININPKDLNKLKHEILKLWQAQVTDHQTQLTPPKSN